MTAPEGSGFNGELSFRATGSAELWDPVTGIAHPIEIVLEGQYSKVKLDLVRAASCFIVFRKDSKPVVVVQKSSTDLVSIPLLESWKLSFPEGWGAPASLLLTALKPWKDLNISAEGKAFSGTATYTTAFNILRESRRRRLVSARRNGNSICSLGVYVTVIFCT